MFSVTSLVLAVSLSMDSFAAALGRGAIQRQTTISEAFQIGITLGICQWLMALLGWGMGFSVAEFAPGIDGWMALLLLAIVGGTMIYNGLYGESTSCPKSKQNNWFALLIIAFATSIDAGAVGAGLAGTGIDIAFTGALIGIVTFIMGFGGVILGRLVGPIFGSWAEVFGGLGLFAVGIKIFSGYGVM